MGATAVVGFAILVRQFASDALRAVSLDLPTEDVAPDQGAGNASGSLPDSL